MLYEYLTSVATSDGNTLCCIPFHSIPSGDANSSPVSGIMPIMFVINLCAFAMHCHVQVDAARDRLVSFWLVSCFIVVPCRRGSCMFCQGIPK